MWEKPFEIEMLANENGVVINCPTVEAYMEMARVLDEHGFRFGNGVSPIDEDGKEPIFAIGTTEGCGNINQVGASFGRESHDDDKYATITMVAGCATDGDIKEWVADRIGTAIINLNKLEEKLPAVLEEIAAEKAEVMSNITVAQ